MLSQPTGYGRPVDRFGPALMREPAGFARQAGCIALALLLAVSTRADSFPWQYSNAPGVSSKVIKRTPYELIIHLMVDGHPMTFDRRGVCSLVVTRYHNWPTPARSSWQWSDDIPYAVAAILPDHEGVIIQLPELCFWPYRGESGRQERATAPLISQAALARVIPQVIWTRDVRHIDSFELYTPIKSGVLGPRHAWINSISVRVPDSESHPTAATPEEVALAQRFSLSHLGGGGVDYVAHAAYVWPVSAWDKDPVARTYFSKHKRLLFIPARGSPLVESSDVANVYGALLRHVTVVPGLANAVLYEVPMVREGDDWVLDPTRRGVRTYYEYSEVQPVPGQRYYRTVVKRAGWGTEAPLTYKGFKLFAPMYRRQRERYLQSHTDIKQIMEGRLFDPEASALIGVGIFEMSR